MTQAPRSELLARRHQLNRLLDRHSAVEAEAMGARSRQEFPQDGEIARLHAHALQLLGRLAEAHDALLEAQALAPDSIEVQCSLANLDMDRGDNDGAIERLRATLKRQPGHPAILLVLGNALMAAARFAQARESFAMATHGAPAHAGLRLNLASAELELGNVDQASRHIDEALQLAPQFDSAHAMRARVLQVQGRVPESIEAWSRAESLAPDNPVYPFHAGLLLDDMGDVHAAGEAFARALRIDPQATEALAMLVFARRRTFDWLGLDGWTDKLHQAVLDKRSGILPFTYLAEDATAREQRQCAETFAAGVAQASAPLIRELGLTHTVPAAGSPVRIGLVSNGFGDRPIGQLIVGVVEKLSAADLDVHLFSLAPADGGAIRRRLEAATTVHDLPSVTPLDLARRIHEAAIEVLVDLRSFGSGSNTDLFELRPAPVQVNWLACPMTSGARWTDYIISDAVSLPATLRDAFSEKVVRLPRCAQPYTPTDHLPSIGSREACGLPATGTVFASFNGSHKLNPASFSRFMLVLAKVPGSVLWLFAEPDDSQQRLRAAAEAMNVAGDRLVFLPRLPHAEHLAHLGHADLFLDTLPCNAQSTAADALWAGCPVLTLVGQTMAGRQCASLLFHAGLPELVTDNEDAFVETAVQLGNDPDALNTLRQHLEQSRASMAIFDTAGFAADFQRAVQAMSARHRIGRPPTDLDL